MAVYMFIVTLRPLVDQAVVTADDWERLEDESLDILLHRDRIIEELRDLEFEAAMDKVEQGDLDVLRRRYEGEALRLMGEIETQVGAYDQRIDADVQDVIERARARRAERAAKKVMAEVAKQPTSTPDEADATGGTPSVSSEPSPEDNAALGHENAPTKENDDLAEESSPADVEPAESLEERVAVRVPFDWIRDLPCEECGTVVKVGSAFCDSCGASVVRACHSCGQDNRLQAKFCKACGESLAEGGGA